MPKLQLETKHTYSYGSTSVSFPLVRDSSAFYSMWPVETFTNYDNWGTQPALKTFMPLLPQQGTKHNDRVGNKIHVLSIRYMLTLELGSHLSTMSLGNPFNTLEYTDSNPEGWRPYASNFGTLPKRWLKMRIMLIKFDKGLNVSPLYFMQWFKSTYLQYRERPSAVASTLLRQPVSVHSQVLHMTTEYTGKFNILFDKCVTLYSNNAQYTIDYTVPLNMTFEFDEENTTTLLSPNLLFIIVPPIDVDVDVDDLTRYQYLTAIGEQEYVSEIEMYHMYAACKMNYMDL